MSYGLSKLKVERLLRQLGEDDEIDGLTPTEAEFRRIARVKHGAKTWRAGWPDFLVWTKTHGFIGVEVKSANDRLRPLQVKTFAGLESAGLKVFVWHEPTPETLIPWRKFANMNRNTRCATKEQRQRLIDAQLSERAFTEKTGRYVSRGHRSRVGSGRKSEDNRT